MDRRRLNAGALELLSQAIRAVLGARENEHLRPASLADQMCEQMALVVFLYAIGALFHELDGRVAREIGRAHV